MYNIKYSKKFSRSLLEILHYYYSISPELVNVFEIEIRGSEDILKTFPLYYSLRYGDIRRFNLNKFPFCIFYKVSNKNIRVIDIVHQSRDPKFWP
jgi:plasmid stabilization system protein ParE